MTPRETATQLAHRIGVAVEAEVMRRRGSRPREARQYVYASGIKPCARRMALDMLATEERIDPEGAARMMRGTERETDVIRLLEDAGKWSDPRFRVVQGELPVKIKGRDGSPLLSGRLDGRLLVEGLDGKPPFEVKSGRVAERCFRYEDFQRSPWGWSYPRQLLVYLLSTGEEFGYLVLDTGGLPRLIPVVLEDHLEDAEEALRLAEEAVAAVKGETLPAFHRDRLVCKSCPFFMGACSPPIDFGEGFGIITDPRVIEALEARARNKEASKEYDVADAELKALLKGSGFEGDAVAGRFMLKQSWRKKTTTTIPKELKAQYETVDPKGTYWLEIKEVLPVEEGA